MEVSIHLRRALVKSYLKFHTVFVSLLKRGYNHGICFFSVKRLPYVVSLSKFGSKTIMFREWGDLIEASYILRGFNRIDA